MVVAKCISKNRNNRGVIVNYTLQDQSGQQRVVTGQQIKEAIQAGKIDIVNLQIDKAGRLVDKAEDKRRIDRKHNVYSIPHTVEEANAWLESMGANELRIGKQEYKNNARYGVYTIKNNRMFIISTVLESLCLCIDYVSTNNESYRMFSECVKLPHKNWVDNEGYEEDGYNCFADCLYFNEELKIFVEGTPEGMYGVLKKHKTTESCLYSDRADNSVHVETFARYGRAGGYAYVVCDNNGNKKKLSSIKKGYTTSNEEGVETNIYVPVEIGDYYIEYSGGIVRIHKIISLDGNYINTEMTEYNPETQLLDLEILKKQFGKLAPAIEFAYKKAFDPELKMGDYAINVQ